MANYLFRDLEKADHLLAASVPCDPDYLHHRIDELRYSACEGGKAFGQTPTLDRAVKVIGGAAIFTTNVAADVIIGGLASAVSVAYGGYLFFKGVDGV